MMLTGMGYYIVITGAVIPLIADFVLKSGNYIPIFVARDSYYQELVEGYGQQYGHAGYQPSVEKADQILVIEHGKIVQRGTHELLINEDGIYRRFVGERREAASWKLGR